MKARLCLFVVVGLAGCKSLSDKIISRVENKCQYVKYNGCEIALTEVTDFTWNKMYLFNSWTTTDSITKFIGFRYSGSDDVQDKNTRMIFTK